MSGRVSMALTAVDPDNRWRVGVVAKRTYDIVGRTVREAPQQIPLAEEPALAADGLTLAQDLDVLLRKPMTDVVVLGHAYPHDGDRKGLAFVRIAERQRDLRVFGERRLERSLDGLRLAFSQPERFEKVPLGWSSAYGGHDAAALEAHGDPTLDLRKQAGASTAPEFGLYAYPRNPAGKGYLVEVTPRALELCRLPQLEDPKHLLAPEAMVAGNSLAWPAGAPPASTAFLPHAFFPRMTLLGIPAPLYDFARFPPSSFLEVAAGLIDASALAEDAHVATLFDLRGLQCSAPGLRWATVPAGVEIELRGMHPRQSSWGFRLEVRAPKLYVRVGKQKPAALVPAIKTMVIEPDQDRVTLLWVGEAPLDLPFTPADLETLQHAVTWS
jgi:hypothetical protein